MENNSRVHANCLRMMSNEELAYRLSMVVQGPCDNQRKIRGIIYLLSASALLSPDQSTKMVEALNLEEVG